MDISESQRIHENTVITTKKTQVTAHELGAAIEAINDFRQHIKDNSIDIYIDNTAAEAILRKGRSKHRDLNDMVESFNIMCFQLNLKVNVVRVAF